MTLAINLAGYYRLDEASGNAIDSVSANTLTANNAPGSGTGKIGNARTFNGSNKSFTAASSSVFNFGDTDFTIACWVNLSSVAAQSMLVTKFSTVGNNRQYALYYNIVTGRMSFLVNSSGASAQNVTINADAFGAIATGTWYYVVAWHDSVNNQIGISVNGVANTQSHSAGVFQSSVNFRVGGRADGFEFTNGLIDGVGVWSKVLTSDERARLYNSGDGLSYPRIVGSTGIGGEVAWWCPSLDTIGNGTTLLNDLTGNGNNGTLTNMDPATDWVADAASGGVRALDFDGVNDFVNVANSSAISATGSHSLTFWIRGSDNTNKVIFEKGTNALLVFQPNGANQLYYLDGSAGPANVTNIVTSFIDGNWHHVALVLNGTNRFLFVDSVQRHTSVISPLAANTSPLVIGSRSGSFPFSGRLDDIRYFPRAISALEITALASQRGYNLRSNTRRRRYAGAHGL